MKTMEYAREAFVRNLYEPRKYRVGKVSGIGQAKTESQTIVDLEGRGVLKRIWTTHKNGERVKVHVYLDGNTSPVLSGYCHELAEAISCERVPLGGYRDRLSVSFYIPLPFSQSLRIDAEPVDETGDGPYWQIDYAMDCDESWPLPRRAARPARRRSPAPIPWSRPIPARRSWK